MSIVGCLLLHIICLEWFWSMVNNIIYVSFVIGLCSIALTFLWSQVPAIGCQWFSLAAFDDSYEKQIACSRTFCIYEEVDSNFL